MKNLIIFLILSVISGSISAQNFDLLKNRAKKATRERFEKSWLNVEILEDAIVVDVQQDKNAGLITVITEITFKNTTPWVIYSYGDKRGFVIDGKLPEFPYCNYHRIEQGGEFVLKTYVTLNEAMDWGVTEMRGYWDTSERGNQITAKRAKEITDSDYIQVDESEIWNEPDTSTHYMLYGVWKNQKTGEEFVITKDKFMYLYATGNIEIIGSDIIASNQNYTLTGKNREGKVKQILLHGINFSSDGNVWTLGEETFVKQK